MITQPYPNFIRPDAGGNVKPISNGLIYIGKEGLDPVSNPIDVFYIDNAGTEQKIDQPIRLNATGIPVAGENDGTIILPYTKASVYSILITDKISDHKYTDLTSTGASTSYELSSSVGAIVGGNVYPDIGYLDNGDVVPASNPPYNKLKVKIDGDPKIVGIYPTASGVINSISSGGAQIGGVNVKFSSTAFLESLSSIYAMDHIDNYLNPTIEEITFLMNCGRLVLWHVGVINLPNVTINQSENTIWEAIIPDTVIMIASTTGYAFDTNGNTQVCGLIGITIDANYISENVVRFANCKHVISTYSTARNIFKTNDETKNYRGGFIYQDVEILDQGGNHAENIEQTPTGSGPTGNHGQHHSFSYNGVGLVRWNGAANTAKNVDKLWHCDGTTKGDTGHHIGEDINDNVCYVLGTPQGIEATFDATNYQEGIVFNPSGDSDVSIPRATLRNGTSRVLALRKGSGLNIGKLKSFGSRTGISDDNYDGSQGVTIDYCYLQDVEVERAISISKSGLSIGRMKTVGIKSTQFNEVARIGAAANFDCEELVDLGGTAQTCLRLNEFTTGSNRVGNLKTDKANKVVYEGGKDFGGKSFIDRINGFLIQGGAPSTLVINSGSITVTQNSHRLDTENGDGTDDLTTILGAPSIDTIITLQTTSNIRDVFVKHGVGNIHLPEGTDIRLNTTNDTIQLKWNGSFWSKPV